MKLNEVRGLLSKTRLAELFSDSRLKQRHRVELYRAKDRYSVKLRMLGDDPPPKMWPSTADRKWWAFLLVLIAQ
ncbi:E3 ubiquitin-protein ligase COP1 [Bienertia sinuspersici]